MRQRVLILLLAWSVGLSAAGYANQKDHSRGSAFELGIGAGYGSLGYQASQVPEGWTNTTAGRPSGMIHVGYACFFSEYVGLSLGVDFTRYGSADRISGTMLWRDVVDTDDYLGFGAGEKYDHRLSIDKWREIQSISYVEVPLSLKFSAPANGVYVIGEVGAKLGVPVLRNYYGSGSLTHSGYYPYGNVTLQNIAGHGFYTEKNYHPAGTFENNTLKWSVFAKLGVAIPLVERLDLTVQALGQYAFDGRNVGGGLEMPGFRDDREGFADAHYFMESYSSVLASRLVTGTVKPWHVGLEIGIRYTIPHSKKLPCRCLNQQFVPLGGGGDDF